MFCYTIVMLCYVLLLYTRIFFTYIYHIYGHIHLDHIYIYIYLICSTIIYDKIIYIYTYIYDYICYVNHFPTCVLSVHCFLQSPSGVPVEGGNHSSNSEDQKKQADIFHWAVSWSSNTKSCLQSTQLNQYRLDA